MDGYVFTWPGASNARNAGGSSDTYDAHYDNPSLIPQVQTAPMEENESAPYWELDNDRGDTTVEDICEFYR